MNFQFLGQCCQCDEGWMGINCNIPLCDPSCLHGICISPNVCKCESSDWKGSACEIPSCPDGCVNGVCISPSNCQCFYGFKGKDCNLFQSTPSCVHGTATYPDLCDCEMNWKGRLCEIRKYYIASCDRDCANGYCMKNNICECWPGFLIDDTTQACTKRDCYSFDPQCIECSEFSCIRCQDGFYLNSSKCNSCNLLDFFCISCDIQNCFECVYPYNVIQGRCKSNGIFQLSNKFLSIDET